MTAVRETEFKVRRKIHSIGGSLVVVLPKIWTEAKGVTKGDEVTVQFDGILQVVPDSDLPQRKATK